MTVSFRMCFRSEFNSRNNHRNSNIKSNFRIRYLDTRFEHIKRLFHINQNELRYYVYGVNKRFHYESIS